MKHRGRPLSFLLALCLLFGAFLSNPSISLASGPAENEQTAEAGVTYEDVLAGLADPYDFFGPLDESSVPEAVGYEKAIENLHVERMYEEEGDSLYNVIFKNADGSRTQYLFDHPVKYVTETGEIEDIRLNVVQDAQTPGAYRTAANSAVTTFSQRLSDGISLRAGDVSLRLIPAGAPSASASAVSAARRLDADTVAYTYDDKTDYEYSLTYTGFKEDIVVREYTGQTEYEFTIITNGLTLTDRDGSYYLTDGSGAVKATIGDIIIFTADERNNAFGTLTHETVRANQEYKLTIHIDPEYLLDEDTAYPIRIDPTIEITSAAGAIEDVTLNSLTGSDGDSWSLTVGKRATYGISRVLMKFPGLSLSAIPSADKITSATVELRDLMCEDESMMVYCYVFTGNTWTESTANWSNVNPNSYTDLLSSKLVSYSSGASLPTPHRYSFNITDAVKGWKTGNYTQSKGILFKTTASTENGSTYIKKTFSSYNRSSYKPSLTVNYTTGGTQTVANGTYYLNGKEGGGYLRYSSGEASAKSGLISSLGNSIRWEIQAVDGGYVLRSKSDTTKYLAVPSTSNSTLVTIETVSESTLPTRCIWTISIAAGGGCLIKNAYNGKYLYSYGTGTLSMSSTLGTSGTSQYYTRVWRIITPTNMAGKELTQNADFSTLVIAEGASGSPVFTANPSNAVWVSNSDFTYSRMTTSYVSLSFNVFSGIAEGTTTVIATHKVTDRKFVFAVIVGERPTYTLRHYVDQGYRVRFGGYSDIAEYTDVVAEKFEQFFGIQVISSTTLYTSPADTCKINRYGSVTAGNLTASCTHSPTHLTTQALRNALGNGTATMSKVLWTGHILPGNPSSNSAGYSVIITPRHTTSGSGYTNKSDSDVRIESIFTLMHETSHQLGLPDHYCYDENTENGCPNLSCDRCYNGMQRPRQCLMSYRYDVETVPEATLYCTSCLAAVNAHLANHHQ